MVQLRHDGRICGPFRSPWSTRLSYVESQYLIRWRDLINLFSDPATSTLAGHTWYGSSPPQTVPQEYIAGFLSQSKKVSLGKDGNCPLDGWPEACLALDSRNGRIWRVLQDGCGRYLLAVQEFTR